MMRSTLPQYSLQVHYDFLGWNPLERLWVWELIYSTALFACFWLCLLEAISSGQPSIVLGGASQKSLLLTLSQTETQLAYFFSQQRTCLLKEQENLPVVSVLWLASSERLTLNKIIKRGNISVPEIQIVWRIVYIYIYMEDSWAPGTEKSISWSHSRYHNSLSCSNMAIIFLTLYLVIALSSVWNLLSPVFEWLAFSLYSDLCS